MLLPKNDSIAFGTNEMVKYVHVRLIFLVPEEPPVEFDAETILSTSILLSWQAPESSSINGIIVNYLIDVVLNNAVISTYNTSDTTYSVTKLRAFTNYTFMVSIVNQVGKGPSTELVVVTDSDGNMFTHNLLTPISFLSYLDS